MLNKTNYHYLLKLNNVIILQSNTIELSGLMHDSVQIITKKSDYLKIIIKENSVVTLTQLILDCLELETEIIVNDNSILNYVLIQFNTENCNFNLKQYPGKNSTINSYIFNYSNQQSQLNYICDFNYAHAINNLYSLQNNKNNETYDLNVNINHNNPHCISTTQIQSIANDKAKASITGKIYVAKHASNTNANLQTKGILLADSAEINARPQLEIYNNEVQCAHGSTIGCLDVEEIFYLKSRGLPEEQARKILLDAFIAPTLPTTLALPPEIKDIII